MRYVDPVSVKRIRGSSCIPAVRSSCQTHPAPYGTDTVDTILSQAQITDYFDDSICGDEVTKGKPNPEVFLKSCQKLGVNVDEAIVLEDSEAGIQASYDANIKVICIPDMKYPKKQYEEKTFKILKDLTEVTAYLKSL